MLTGADLDTTHSLDGALVQISFPSQTQTSRQIAWANVIGVTSSNKKKRKTEKSMLAIANYMEFLLIFSNHFSGEKWQQKSKEEKEER